MPLADFKSLPNSCCVCDSPWRKLRSGECKFSSLRANFWKQRNAKEMSRFFSASGKDWALDALQGTRANLSLTLSSWYDWLVWSLQRCDVFVSAWEINSNY